jgi:hypothetical protein
LENNAHGLKDIEFVHHSGFIGGAWSLETAIQMAVISIEAKVKEEEEKKNEEEGSLKKAEGEKSKAGGEPSD